MLSGLFFLAELAVLGGIGKIKLPIREVFRVFEAFENDFLVFQHGLHLFDLLVREKVLKKFLSQKLEGHDAKHPVEFLDLLVLHVIRE